MKLALTEWGSGDRVAILVHGATGRGADMAPLAERLAVRGYRVFAPDLRGHGRSPRGGPYALQALAEDLVETLPVHAELVAGHSVGGKVLPLAISGLAPERAIYLDPAWHFGPQPLGGIPLAPDDGGPMTTEHVARIFPDLPFAQREAMVEGYLAMDWALFHDPAFKLKQDTPPPEHPEVPSLVVRADPSEIVPDWLADRLAAGGYEVRTQPGAGHGLFLDDMPGFLAKAHDWL